MSGMAGKNYAGTNANRLTNIPLGSGNVYILPVNSTYPTAPTDAQFEVDANMIGRTGKGAKLTYATEYYTVSSDDGVAKRTKLTKETATFAWGVMTWNANTIKQMLQTATVSTVSDIYGSRDRVKVGGVGNQDDQEYWVHFVGGDPVSGKITVTGRGLNTAGLEAAFAVDNETMLSPSFEFSPLDADGTLFYLDMPKMSAVADSAPKLTALTIGALTLSPTFDGDTLEYTASTTSSSATITATAASGTQIVILVNGDSLTNGGTATWEDGENEVVVTVSDTHGSTTYKATVTKS